MRARSLAALALVALAALAALAARADARTSANPANRTVLGPDGGIVKPGRVWGAAAARTAATLAAAPLPAGAVALDSTWYDLQDMASLGPRIVVAADGRVHVTYQKDFCEIGGPCPPNLNLPQPYPQRGMAYTLRDANGTWQHLGKVSDPDIRNCCLTELFGGFGTIAVTPAGRAVISQHMNEEGCDLRGNFYLEDASGGSSWTAYLTPIVSPSYLFPQVTALPNGSFVVLGEVPRGGEYDEVNDFRVSRVNSAGTLFTCPIGWQGSAWTAVAPTTIFKDGRGAFPSLASASDGRVGIAIGDFGGNVFLIESSNGTFNAGTVTIRNLTNYDDAAIVKTDSTSTEYRAYVNCALAYNDTLPNVVWSELQARKSGTTVRYYDWHSRIRHWDPVHGASTVKQVQAGEADTYDNVDNLQAGPLCGFNTISVDWPQVGFSEDGSETYVGFVQFRDDQVDPTADMGLPGIVTGVGFGDVAIATRRGAGAWSAPQNVTNTPTTDERFFSIAARNPGGKAHLLLQASATNQAGVVVIGDRGASPGNILRRIAYLEPTLAASLVAVEDGVMPGAPALRSWPNPSRGRVAFSAPAGAGAGGWVRVFGVDGRFVARARVSAAGEAVWDGRDAGGRTVPDGVYFARMEGREAGPGTKFLMLH